MSSNRFDDSKLLAALALFFVVVFYFSTEALFILTKPSFLTGVSTSKALLVALASFLPAALAVFIVIGLGWVIIIAMPEATRMVLRVARFIAAFVFALTLFILINNFTYTIFTFGALTARGFGRAVYAAVFLFLVWYALRIISSVLRERAVNKHQGKLGLVATALFLVCLGSAAIEFYGITEAPYGSADFYLGTPQGRPNVIIVSSDALWADSLSVYGYQRETTPFLNEFTESNLLLFENTFSNANRSPGSLMSMLTGKNPLALRLLINPDILVGESSYEHLPAILRRYGYSSLEMSNRVVTDSFDLNMREAFSEANYRRLDGWLHRLLERFPAIYNSREVYFILQLSERALSILKHTFLIQTYRSLYWELTGGYNNIEENEAVVDRVDGFIRNASRPFFVHLHLLGTHGPYYTTRSKLFSGGKRQDRVGHADYYDDAIRDFDEYLARIFRTLSEVEQLNNTIVVIHSDHSKRFDLRFRIPLLFYFPEGRYTGRVVENAQLLDIAPTVLDFMGLKKPDWVEGRSLIAEKPDRYYPILAAADYAPDNIQYQYIPPFDQFRLVTAVICDKWFSLDLMKNSLTSGRVVGHTETCPEENFPREEEVREMLVSNLSKHGFDVRELRAISSQRSKQFAWIRGNSKL